MSLVGKSFWGATLLFAGASLFAESVIIDHNCIDINKVPKKFIDKAKTDFKIAYGHTSHGSQIVSGMEALKASSPLYRYAKNGKAGKILSLWDYTPSGDLGNPDRTSWADRTRELLQSNGKDRNLIMWSWCGQVGSATEADIENYLKLMSDLEKEFPKVKFVYMTGHLDGSGKDGNLNKRNEQIREFCRNNGKILFDFADIESYSPTGDVNYMELFGTDGCTYKQGGAMHNWAEEWLAAHPESEIVLPGTAAHTNPLNGAMKGRAFWWMLARLSGWDGSPFGNISGKTDGKDSKTSKKSKGKSGRP